MNFEKLVRPYKVREGKHFHLSDIDPGDTRGLKSKEDAAKLLTEGIELLSKYQDMLYAQNHWALLLIFQAMDGAGKDSTIKHVMSGLNPQGCQVYSFKVPSEEELDHDFLWRANRCLPERGKIGVFNRSYYEEVLVVRVHPEILNRQRIPKNLVTKKIWQERYEDINHFESYLSRNGVLIRKFFLHVSKEEQRRRFLKRLEEPEKNWKFSPSDVKERHFWNTYQNAYEEMICQTSSRHAPWHVIPADHKWFMRAAVSAVVVEALASLQLKYPEVKPRERKELRLAEKSLKGGA